MPTFTNRQFGTFEYSEDYALKFPSGIIGFEQLKNFLIINDDDSQPFRWLVSLDDGDLHFPVLDPSFVVESYDRHIPGGNEKAVFLIASLHEHPEESTVNLRSPVVIDGTSRTGKQVILDDESLSVRYRFLNGADAGKR